MVDILNFLKLKYAKKSSKDYKIITYENQGFDEGEFKISFINKFIQIF